MMRVISLDTETAALRAGVQAPRIVCLTYVDSADGSATPRILDEQQAVLALVQWLRDPEVQFVGANIAYDILASVTSADALDSHPPPDGRGGEYLLGLYVAAYDAGRVHDVLVRQKLLDLAAGVYWQHKHDYSLGGLARRHAGINLDKENPWRVRYGELRGVPFEQWPPDALSYALDDAHATAVVFAAQDSATNPERLKAAQKFPGYDPLADEQRQTCAALWLKAMSCYGLRTDPEAVERFAAYVRAEHVRLCEWLSATPLVRKEYKRQLEAIAERARAIGRLESLRRADGKIGLTKYGLTATGDRLLAAIGDWKTTVATAGAFGYEGTDLQALVDAGLVKVKYTRDTKAAQARIVAAYAALGREAPRSVQKKKDEHGRTVKKTGGIALDKDACRAAEDPLLEAYADISHLGKILSADVPALASGAYMPIHTNYESLRETGRTASSNPNVQNRSRGFTKPCSACDGRGDGCPACHGEGEVDAAGDRECFVPRAGYVLIDNDYAQGELWTFAQVCKWWLGFTTMGDLLKADRDVHTHFAINIWAEEGTHVSYDEFKHLVKVAKDTRAIELRTCAKGQNFGGLGGLGAETMATMAFKSYGVRRSVAQWKRIQGVWRETFAELKPYFALINRFETAPRSRDYNIVTPYSGLLRARCTYCAAANHPFQSLLAVVAKRAGWLQFKACYLDRSSPLFGSRPVNFVHDSFMIETLDRPEAHDAATESARLMTLAAREVCPDYPTYAEPMLTRRWSKKASELRDESGRLVAWEHGEFRRAS